VGAGNWTRGNKDRAVGGAPRQARPPWACLSCPGAWAGSVSKRLSARLLLQGHGRGSSHAGVSSRSVPRSRRWMTRSTSSSCYRPARRRGMSLEQCWKLLQ